MKTETTNKILKFGNSHKLELTAFVAICMLGAVLVPKFIGNDAPTVERSTVASTVESIPKPTHSTPPKDYVIVQCDGEFTFKYPNGSISAIHRYDCIGEAIDKAWEMYEYLEAEDKKKWEEAE